MEYLLECARLAYADLLPLVLGEVGEQLACPCGVQPISRSRLPAL
jgi:hypothetical protein